jgi:hypothetical protein
LKEALLAQSYWASNITATAVVDSRDHDRGCTSAPQAATSVTSVMTDAELLAIAHESSEGRIDLGAGAGVERLRWFFVCAIKDRIGGKRAAGAAVDRLPSQRFRRPEAARRFPAWLE